MTGSRDQWIKDICAGLVALFDNSTALGAGRISGELGDPTLLRALLILRIAVLEANGRSAPEAIARLADIPVFDGPPPVQNELTELVTRVRWRMEEDGITGWVLLNGLGLRLDGPESTYRLLVDIWAGQRARMVTRNRLRRELKAYWETEDLPATGFGGTDSPGALEAYCDLSSRLAEEPDKSAANFVALGLIKKGHDALGRWLTQFPAPKARHLRALGSDRATCQAAAKYLRTAIGHPSLDDALRPVAVRALALVEGQLAHVSEAVASLGTLERDLLRERTEEESFRDGCLFTFLSPVHGRDVVHDVGRRTRHGVWGTVPRWSITAQQSDEAEAIAALLDEGALPLGFEWDPHASRLLSLTCRKPRTETPGMIASFMFDLDNPFHACELLLIGRRNGFPVDLYAQSEDEEYFDAEFIGALRVPVGPELAQYITEIASEALTQIVPGIRNQTYDIYDGIPLLRKALQRSGPALVREHSTRRSTKAAACSSSGTLQALVNDPPVPMGSFFRYARENRPKEGDAAEQRALPASPREIGFVYIQRNPAFSEMLKIGCTKHLAEDRAKALSGTSVPYSFEVLHRVATTRPVEVERAVHRLLVGNRVSADREFFRVSLETAVQAIDHCMRTVTGIQTWAPPPTIHRLLAGDRVVLPLRAGQVFALTAWPDLSSRSAEVLDLWQAHSDNDLLEIYATSDPGHVAGFSDRDPGGDEDPVPYVNREKTVKNQVLIGRERLVAGDRLVWLSDRDGPKHCRSVVFESDSFCQVTCRTSSPQVHPSGWPLLLNALERDLTPAMKRRVREALTLPEPDIWAPRSPQPDQYSDCARPATDPQPPEYWLPQLKPRP